MSNSSNNEQIRQKAMEIGQRAKNDAEFLRRLQSDPVATLHEAGLPDEAIPAFMTEEGLEVEVSGYEMIDDWCICTGCCATTITF